MLTVVMIVWGVMLIADIILGYVFKKQEEEKDQLELELLHIKKQEQEKEKELWQVKNNLKQK
jgi:hypothetical protein